ncbi:MAG: rhodanese-related sulfurtransferase [Flavobacteriaceae bacterium]|jgi:rhodanese-related sulfurtransferase|uniref:rhodanese-like domain-containing protein n=1 Tax=Candidatus Marifrigoribacter sp. Uisw_064 TaxID=3230970 RepID=UPI003AEADF8F
MKKILLIIVCLSLFAFQSCNESSKNPTQVSEIELISPQQVYEAIYGEDSVQIVDVRTSEEFSDSHLKGAQNICVTNNDFKEKIKTLDKEKPVYLYCKMGGRSARAAKILKKMGFKKVYDMEGGITSWKDKNLMVE